MQPRCIQFGHTPLAEAVKNGKEETVVLLIGFKADINLPDKVTRGMGWEGVARADGRYTLCTNLHAYSQILRDNLLLASVDCTTLRPRLIFLLF